MKKITQIGALVLSGFIAMQASAQITITSADLPYSGLTVMTATDSTSIFTPGPAGTNQSWNFGTAKKQLTDKILFMLPSATPYASTFTAANLADSTVGKTGSGSNINGYNFFNINSSVFEVEGSEQIVPYNYSGIPLTFQVKVNLKPEFVQANLPGVYGEKFNGVSRGRDDIPKNLFSIYDSVRVQVNITYFDTVDAWGTLTLPTGTFNVLRKNHHEVDVDSVSEHSTGGSWGTTYSTIVTNYHQYQWFTNGAGYILAEMNVNPSTGAYENLIWDTTAVPLGINELSYNSKVITYPNPCSSQITFQVTSNTQAQLINVYDITGRLVNNIEMKNNMSVLNTSAYSSGMYLYTINDKNGNVVDHGKFMVK